MTPTKTRGRGKKPEPGKFDKIIDGLLTQVLKDRLFNGVRYIRGGQMGRLDEKPEGSGMEVVDA